MAIVGLFFLAFALVTASAEPAPALEDAKQVEASDIDIFNDIDGELKRISRSADYQERFGLIRGSIGLVRKLVRNTFGLLKAIIHNVLVAIKTWFLGPPKVPYPVVYPTFPPGWNNVYGPTPPPYVPPGNYYGLPA